MTEIIDSLIIGSGPAGLTAAIYNARADVKSLVIAGNQPGGQLTITPMVDNYPGFVNGVGGFKLMMDMQAQTKKLGIEIRQGVVKDVRCQMSDVRLFEVELESGEIIKSKTVIVTTGARAKWLGLENEQEMIGRGVSGCATCDGMFFRDKTVAVVGGGDTACEDASFLAKFTKKVYMIVRKEEFRASVAEQKKVLENEKIEILWNSEIRELRSQISDVRSQLDVKSQMENNKLESVKIFNNKTNEEKILPLDGLFVAIGNLPATDFLKGLVDLRESGQIITGNNKEFMTMTNIEGIFAAGDCVNLNHRQAIVAAGDGCRAALDAQRWIER